VIHTVAPYLLPDLIPALHERAPQMPLDIEENLTENLEAGLKSGRLDAAIVALPFAPPGVVTEFLYEEPFQVVVPSTHKWAKRKSVQPAELAGENTILLNVGHCFRDQVSSPARSSTRRTRTCRVPIPSRPFATWWPRASASRCCRATR
jgi:LysR family hydrogen peroxide-inducible transcriptional activator